MRYITTFLLLLTVSCGTKNTTAQTKFHDDGRAKPTVVLVPVFDRSNAELAWSLSEEMTAAIRSRLLKRGNFYLAHPSMVSQYTAHLTHKDDPFGTDISWTKEAFQSHEFVIFAEVVQHHLHEKTSNESFLDKLTPSGELDMTMRLRIVDLRGNEAKIILQEMISQNHLLPKSSIELPKDELKWKRKTYFVSPLGFAHLQMSKEVSRRVEDYILLAQSFPIQ